jgi:hypothetical protein
VSKRQSSLTGRIDGDAYNWYDTDAIGQVCMILAMLWFGSCHKQWRMVSQASQVHASELSTTTFNEISDQGTCITVELFLRKSE